MAIKYLIMMIFFFLSHFVLLKGQDRIMARDKFDWKEYDSTSKIYKDSIDYHDLQGKWIAYEGITIGDYEIGWKTTNKPKVLEIMDENYRNNLSDEFNAFYLNKNLIIFKKDNMIDTAFINRITAKEMTISYKINIDYEQYFYKKY
jgi:hypothetical protein